MASALYRHPRLFRYVMNAYPPYWGTGIRLTEIAPDFSSLSVTMALRFYNRNAFGTQFGGSLYAMCDPHYVLLLVAQLGSGYEVWDKGARIEFLRPGRGPVFAHFAWSRDAIAEIIDVLDQGARSVQPERTVDVLDADGHSVARVHKTLYIRKKRLRRR